MVDVVLRDKLLRAIRIRKNEGGLAKLTTHKKEEDFALLEGANKGKVFELEQYKYNYLKAWVGFERLEALTVALSLIFATIEYETEYVNLRSEFPRVPFASRALIALISLLSIYFLFMRVYYKHLWANVVKDDYEGRKALVHRTVMRHRIFTVGFISELFMILIQPLPMNEIKFIYSAGYPQIQYEMTLSELLYILMFLKLVILLRFLVSSSLYMNSDSQYLCYIRYEFPANARYAFKCLTKNHPLAFALTSIFGFIFMLSVLMRIWERPYRWQQYIVFGHGGYMDFDRLDNCIWCTILTMTTVGYGDIYPRTVGGRVCESIACIWGGFVISIWIVVVTTFLRLTPHEKEAFYLLSIYEPAAKVIGEFFTHLQCRLNTFESLTQSIVEFCNEKRRAGRISADIFTLSCKFEKEMNNRIKAIEEDVDVLLDKLAQDEIVDPRDETLTLNRSNISFDQFIQIWQY